MITSKLDWLHVALIFALALVSWIAYQNNETLDSAKRLIATQEKALDTSHRALESTAEWKKFKSEQRGG